MSPPPDQRRETIEPIGATAAPPAAAPVEPAPIDTTAPADAAPVDAAEPADAEPVSLQTIAAAYGDFTRRSLEETRSFVERLSGAGSLDKAMQLQTEFARQAYKTFVEEAQKIRGLHSELAKTELGAAERPREQVDPGRALDFRGAKATPPRCRRGDSRGSGVPELFLRGRNGGLKHAKQSEVSRKAGCIFGHTLRNFLASANSAGVGFMEQNESKSPCIPKFLRNDSYGMEILDFEVS